MSELVQKRMESMTQEFEDMCRTKLFSTEESRKIMKKRKDFEYKINGLTKNPQDFKDYISYERYLLRDIRLRRDRLRIDEKRASIEHSIMKRVKLLYETALQRFSDDRDLCISYFKYCKSVRYLHAANQVISSMIKRHPDSPEVWLQAAEWHALDRKDIGAAIKHLIKAVAIHKDNQQLYSKVIELQLLHTVGPNWSIKNAESQSENEIAKQKLCCEKLNAYFDAILLNIKDFEYYIELLELLEKYNFTNDIQNRIIDHLLQEYSDKETVWHTLAQREFKGLHYKPENDNSTQTNSTKARLTCCFAKYQEGLTRVPEDKKPNLWSMYLDHLIDLQRDNFGVAGVFKTNALKSSLEQAYSEGCLMEKHYVTWLEQAGEEKALDVLEKGTTALPHSVELWKSRLQYQMIKDVSSEVDQVFKLAILALKETALPLWTATIRYHLLTSNDEIIDAIYKDGVKQPKEVSQVLKPQYIEWLTLSKGINAARKAYSVLVTEKPYCKELHVMMSKLESMEIDYNFEAWVEVHKLACEQFGKEDVDVWLDYVKFYVYYNKGSDINNNVQTIIKQAESQLNSSLKIEFLHKYDTLMNSM